MGVKERTVPLNERQLLFVTNYIRHGEGIRAAIEAGYSPNSAKMAQRKLLKDPRVLPLLEQAKVKVLLDDATKEAKFTYEMAMLEAEEAMLFAKEMENAGAYVKAVEHRAKLSGLLVDRIDVSQNVNFRVVIGGIDLPKTVTETSNLAVAGIIQKKEFGGD